MKKDQLFPSRYMKGLDLQDKPWSFTIASVRLEEMRNPQGEKEKKAVVYFKGPKKGLIVTPTIFDQIAQATGQDDTDNWPGHLITIYPTTVFAFGKNNLVIRVRPTETAQSEAPDTLMHDDEDLTLD